VAVDANGLGHRVRSAPSTSGAPTTAAVNPCSGVGGLSGSSSSTLIIRWCWHKRPALVPTQWLGDALRPLVDAAHQVTPLGVVLADAE
jgi:hypothetical protein